MAFAKRMQPGRRGLTLIELLMVISIMTILMVIAIPLIRPAFKDRYVREAARQVSTFFAGAQARAADLGRPVGVWIERIDNTELGSRHAARLYMAEVPPGFHRDPVEFARVRCSGRHSHHSPRGTLQFPDGSDVVLGTIMSLGERFTIKFDHKGYDYRWLAHGVRFRDRDTVGSATGDRGLWFGMSPTRSHAAPRGRRSTRCCFRLTRSSTCHYRVRRHAGNWIPLRDGEFVTCSHHVCTQRTS